MLGKMILVNRQTNLVVNIIVVDESFMLNDDNILMIPLDENMNVSAGDLWDGTSFIPAPIVEPSKTPIEELQAVQSQIVLALVEGGLM